MIRVAVANPFHVPWLEGKLSSLIHTAVAELVGAPVRVEFVPRSGRRTAVSRRVAPRHRTPPAPLLAQI